MVGRLQTVVEQTVGINQEMAKQADTTRSPLFWAGLTGSGVVVMALSIVLALQMASSPTAPPHSIGRTDTAASHQADEPAPPAGRRVRPPADAPTRPRRAEPTLQPPITPETAQRSLPADTPPAASTARTQPSDPAPAESLPTQNTSSREGDARKAAIDAMRQQLLDELQQYGDGDFDRWGENLQPFRASFRGNRPRTQNLFRFLNTELAAIRVNDFNVRHGERSPLNAVVAMDRFLREHGIDLIYVPIPDKVMVYPDMVSAEASPGVPVAVAHKRNLLALTEAGVEVIDLETEFRRWRVEHQDQQWLYQYFDTHWNNLGAQIAAEAVVRRLQRYEWVRAAQAESPRFQSSTLLVPPGSDLGFPRDLDPNDRRFQLELRQIRQLNGSIYEDVPDSPLIMTADSFGRLWRDHGAQTSAQVAYRINHAVTLLHGTGSGPRIPAMLVEEGPEFLKGRRVMVWTGVSRQLFQGGWFVLPPNPFTNANASPSGVER